MDLMTLVWRELIERKSQMITLTLGILLGITALVAMRNISFYSEKAVARELDSLGANVLVLPKSASLQDYYAADMHDEHLPEEYVMRLTMSDLEGVDNLSPKLCVPLSLGEQQCALTGILPKNEFQAKAAWAGAGIFSRPIGCGAIDVGGADKLADDRNLVRERVIDDLATHECLVGADVAARQAVTDGDTINLLGESFAVVAVLPETGTVDDSRVFAHLHTVQRLANKGEVVNCIEIVGCCKEIAAGLVAGVNDLLPEARVVTIHQVVDTQVKVNTMIARLSQLLVAVVVVVGGMGIANHMFSNVSERKREIGTLMALGGTATMILQVFLVKSLILGVVGGLGGYFLGTGVATFFGPSMANVTVLPMPGLLLWALGVACGVTILGSLIPALRASKLDPVNALREV